MNDVSYEPAYVVMKLIDGEEMWAIVHTDDDLHIAQEVAQNDAVHHGSNFHDAVSYWSDETKYASNWRGRWSRQTTDNRIFYEIIRVRSMK